MLGTIELYKLAFTPNDTMYFDSTESQNAWFESQTSLKIDNISFNGARAFQIGNNYLDVIFNYNYVRYKLNNRYIYAFIENIDYANDNCATLNISIDLNQTFLRELQTAIATSNVGNVTKKESYFKNTYIPYDNKVSVSNYNSIFKGRLNDLTVTLDEYNYYGEYILGYIMFNIATNISYNGSNNVSEQLTDNGYQTNIYCYALPILYSVQKSRLIVADFKIVHNTGGLTPVTDSLISAKQFKNILNDFGSYFEDGCVSIIFEKIGTFDSLSYNNTDQTFYIHDGYNPLQPAVEVDYNIVKYPTPYKQNGYNYGTMVCINIVRNNIGFSTEIDFSSHNIPYSILRQPYVYVRVGNDKESIILNLSEFENYNDNNKLEILFFTSCIYPFTTNLRFSYNGGEYFDKNALFNLTTTTPVPYSLSAWQQYYSQHSASVNDGLATQQKYERQISQNTKNYKQISSAIEWGSDSLSSISKLATGNFVGAGTGFINSTVKMGTSIAGAEVEYTNSEIQREKEKAILDISWNDIKSSPSVYSNTVSGLTSFYRNGIQNIEIHLYIASNLQDIINYHKQYGYKVNRMETLTWADIQQHTVFDYISFNTITLKSTLPQFYTAMIEQQYEQGVRFWYDYANFMNYQIENTERS